MNTILSTKKLKTNQRELILNAGLSFVDYNAIQTSPKYFDFPREIEAVIFTSKNAVSAVLTSEGFQLKPTDDLKCFCVGAKTKALLQASGLKVEFSAENASELANFIIKEHKNDSFHFFCGNLRREELPQLLRQNGVVFEEIEVYETLLTPKAFQREFDAVLFFSPSGVHSFAEANDFGNSLAVCIGATTASAAKKFTAKVVVANATSVESVIAKAVKNLK